MNGAALSFKNCVFHCKQWTLIVMTDKHPMGSMRDSSLYNTVPTYYDYTVLRILYDGSVDMLEISEDLLTQFSHGYLMVKHFFLDG